jgi:hypothetical protein
MHSFSLETQFDSDIHPFGSPFISVGSSFLVFRGQEHDMATDPES